MKKLITFLVLFFYLFITNGHAQSISKNSHLTHSINTKFLEHLIKTKIDSVRKSLDLDFLVNDSILFVASQHHSNYMSSNKRLTHKEKESKLHKTPQDRVNQYGGKNYLVGENVIKSYFNKPMEDKKGREYENNTYEDLANDFVKGWVNSPGHYANIINPDYQITGVSVSIDYDKKLVYSTQKFAKVNFKYQFEENKEMFQYSMLEGTEIVSSFDNIPSRLSKKKFAHKLKPIRDKDSLLCKDCNLAVDNSKFKTQLVFKGKSIYVKSYDPIMINTMIEKWRDGLALEFVEYESYDCGNPEYYTEPSRRNGQSIFNGKISKPIYRRQLRKGFKKVERKKNKGRYRWFNNMGTKGNPEYFYFKLGRIPKEMNGYVEINVVVIKKKRVCRIMHLTNWCGQDYDNYKTYPFRDTLLTEEFGVIPKRDSLSFSIDFELGKSEYSREDIAPIIKTVTSSKFTVLDAKIEAFSSVEGSESVNTRLQIERANSILQAVTENQTSSFKKDIQVEENWRLFYSQIDSFNNLKEFRGKSKEEIKQIINLSKNKGKYEKYFKKQRYASIKLKVEFEVGDTLHFLLNEIRLNQISIARYFKKYGAVNFNAYDSILRIQYYIYKYVKKDEATIEQLNRISGSFDYSAPFSSIHEDYFWYLMDLNDSTFWQQNAYGYLKKLHKIGVREKFVTYNLLNFEMKNYKRKRSASDKKIAQLNGMLYGFSSLTSDTSFLYYVELMKEDFLVKTIKNYHFDSPNFDEPNMRSYINKLTAFVQTKNYSDSILYNFANFIVYCKQEDLAYNFLLTYLYKDTNIHHPSLILFAKLSYKHPKEYPTYKYTDFLIDIKKNLTQEEWCSMFVGPCNISFQTMDDEKFRNFYCEQCKEYPNYAEKTEEW